MNLILWIMIVVLSLIGIIAIILLLDDCVARRNSRRNK